MVQQFIRSFFKKRNRKKTKRNLAVHSQQLEVRKRILLHVRGELYSVYAVCPVCKRQIAESEVIEIFSKNPSRFTLKLDCPECGFDGVRPKIEVNKDVMDFYSPYVSRHLLKSEFAKCRPDEIRKLNPKVFYSIIFNFGSLRNVFESMGYDYKYPEIPGWENRLNSLPKNIPDLVVSECFGIPIEEVCRIRNLKV